MNPETCKQCGQPMAGESPEGLCARCLLSVAMKESDAPAPGDASATEPTQISPEPRDAAAPPKPMPDIPDIGDAAEVARRLPQFEIIELLGRGGMGVVYKARQLNLDRLVALKILPPVDALTPDFVERFRREARSLAKLSHPNIVGVHDFGESGGLYYFAMEFVDSVNLRDMIRSGKMKPEEALAVVPKICDALQFAHEEGVVHRDVKPENILIDKRGRVKIADFGLAKLLRRELTDHTLTMSGMTLGTPRYMAPEQLDKPETVDHRADIYSLGVVFYEMLTGEVPMGRFAPPSEKVRIDVRLDEIVLHALERDADRRYQHVSQMRDDVEKVTSKPQVAPAAAAAPAPHSAPVAPPVIAPELRDKINAAGIFMLVAGIGIAVSGIIGFIYGIFEAYHYSSTVTNPNDNVAARAAGGAFIFLACFLGGIAALNGGLAMRTLRFHTFALLMSILLIVPLPGALLVTKQIHSLEATFIQLAFCLYAGIRAFRLLRKPEVEAAFAANAPAPVSESSSEPQLCNLAVISAGWAIVGLVCGATISFWLYTYRGIPPVMMLVMLLALISVICAPVTGAVAISRIRRSSGQLTGLPFAAFGLLCYPMLLLACAAGGFAHLVQTAFWTKVHTGYSTDHLGHLVNPIAPNPANRPDAMFLILDSLVALGVCFFADFVAWRKIAGQPNESKSTANEIKPGAKNIVRKSVCRFLGLPTSLWPVIAALLVVAAIFVPRPADLKEPKDVQEIFQPMILVTPERDSYRFVGYLNGEWKMFKPVYVVNRMSTARQEGTRTFGWDAKNGASLGFFHQSANWRYQIRAMHIDWKSAADGPLELGPAELTKLTPLVFSELEKLAPGRGERLVDLLQHGREAETVASWQNLVVLLAWLTLPLAVIALFLMFWHTLAGKIVLVVLVVCAAIYFTVFKMRFREEAIAAREARESLSQVAPLGTIADGVGAEFTVPAGQVAVFEIVTRKDGATVPLPSLAAYVIAPAEQSVKGTYRWSREPVSFSSGTRRQAWRIEVLTPGGGRASSGGLDLPEALDLAVGSMSLGLGLEPDTETIHWQKSDDTQLPADGLIGLRVHTQAHGMKAGMPGSSGASGAATADSQKAASSPTAAPHAAVPKPDAAGKLERWSKAPVYPASGARVGCDKWWRLTPTAFRPPAQGWREE